MSDVGHVAISAPCFFGDGVGIRDRRWGKGELLGVLSPVKGRGKREVGS